MNLVQLRYVKVVARAASFSAAARECCVSQPTISNAISDLEDDETHWTIVPNFSPIFATHEFLSRLFSENQGVERQHGG